MGSNIVYTVKNVEFTVDGFKLPVNSVRLDLALNQIPYYMIDVPPCGWNDNLIKIGSPGLADGKQLLKQCFEWANKRAICKLKIELQPTSDGNAGNPVKLELNDWVLGNASLGTVNVTNGYLLNLQVFHPAFNLTKFGLFCDGLAAPLDLTTVSGSDIVSIADSTYKKIVESLNSVPQKTPDKNIESLPRPAGEKELFDLAKKILQLATQNASPSRYLSWGGGGLPLSTVQSTLGTVGVDGQKAITVAMASECIPRQGASVWDSVLAAAENWGCVIVPTYTSSTLSVTPSNPWAKPSASVSDTQISQLQFPSFDSDPVLGIRCVNSQAATLSGVSTDFEDKINENMVSTWCYIPQGVATGDSSNMLAHGRLYNIGTPQWWGSLAAAAQSLRTYDMDGKSHEDEAASASNPDESIESALFAAQVVYAAYIFQLLFKQTFTASFSGPVLLSLIPGSVVSVKDKSGSVFNGYMIGVSHTFSVSSSSAMTSVTLSYCREEGGYKGVCEEGDSNPLYK